MNKSYKHRTCPTRYTNDTHSYIYICIYICIYIYNIIYMSYVYYLLCTLHVVIIPGGWLAPGGGFCLSADLLRGVQFCVSVCLQLRGVDLMRLRCCSGGLDVKVIHDNSLTKGRRKHSELTIRETVPKVKTLREYFALGLGPQNKKLQEQWTIMSLHMDQT